MYVQKKYDYKWRQNKDYFKKTKIKEHNIITPELRERLKRVFLVDKENHSR